MLHDATHLDSFNLADDVLKFVVPFAYRHAART
jgi:hypothetical protein